MFGYINKGLFIGLILFGLYFFSFGQAQAAVPRQSSRVYVKDKQLIVEKRLSDGSLGKPQAFIIRGVNWSPATRAPSAGPDPANPVRSIQYGFFFDWPGREPQGHKLFGWWLKTQYLKYYLADIPLMKQMNVNTIRVYSDFGDNPKEYEQILDELYRNNIMVIMTVVVSKDDIQGGRYRRVVQWCKDHPAILLWCLGNEWNLEYNKYWGYETVAEAAKATNRVASRIKKIDPNHPVGSVLGDRFQDPQPSNTIAEVIEACPDVDVWGLNIYRGRDLSGLFLQWQEITSKPFFFSELGTDSFKTRHYTVVNGYQADNCQGEEDQDMQAEFVIYLWDQIVSRLSALSPNRPCLGGLVSSLSDSLWKVGCYHVSLGGLVDYNSDEGRSYDAYNTEGFYMTGGHPDDVCNEEYFGVVDADRNPKKVFWELQRYYKKIEDLEDLCLKKK